MSWYYMQNGKIRVPEYENPGRTKQAFADDCDINKLLKRAQRLGGLAHVEKYPAEVYGEFDGEMDLLTAHERIDRARTIFSELPSEVRSEFSNDALAFVSFAADPANNARLTELIPAIAEPGRYFPNPVNTFGQGAGAATAPSEALARDPARPDPDADSGPSSGDSAADASSPT